MAPNFCINLSQVLVVTVAVTATVGDAANIDVDMVGYPVRYKGKFYIFADKELHRRSVNLEGPVCTSPNDCIDAARRHSSLDHSSRSKRSPVNPITVIPGLALTLIAGGILLPVNCAGVTGPAILASCPVSAGTLLLKTFKSIAG